MKYLIPFLFLLVSCSPEQTQTLPTSVTPTQLSSRSVISEKLYANPVLIYGSSFGNYIQQLWRINRYDDMVKFTSHETRKRFGDKAILGFYSKMNFGYKLGKMSAMQKIDSLNYILIYSNSSQYATRKKREFRVFIEHDSVKLILNSIDKNFDL